MQTVDRPARAAELKLNMHICSQVVTLRSATCDASAASLTPSLPVTHSLAPEWMHNTAGATICPSACEVDSPTCVGSMRWL